jgi:DNA-binding response OmpR family regulator
MLIVVASANIFRREFSSYILGEAGYEICEARSAEDLMRALRANLPALILIDLQLESADSGVTLRAVRLLSDAPVLWIADPLHHRHLGVRPAADVITWPFRGDDLSAAVAGLLGRVSSDPAEIKLRERYAGSAE